MNFFFDRCFPEQLCYALAVLEEGTRSIYYHDEFFDKDTPDTVWIGEVGKWSPKPIVVSGDTHILKNPDEMRALVAEDLTYVCLAPGWTNTPIPDYPWMFFKAWINILKEAEHCRIPTVFQVAKGASFKVEERCLTRNLVKSVKAG